MIHYHGNGVLRGPDGRPIERPVLLDHNGKPITHPHNDYALPHVLTFSSVIEGANRTYAHDRFDEALRMGEKAHLVMRNDAFLMGLLQERKLATASLKWHLEVDDERDPSQLAMKEALTKVLKSTPNFLQYRYCLLESTWFGRYANQCVWEWQNVDVTAPRSTTVPVNPAVPLQPVRTKVRALTVKKWQPVNGDKLGWTHDGVPYCLIHTARQEEIQGKHETVLTTRGMAMLLKGDWRERFCIGQHEFDDADFWEGEMASSIKGVGIRSRIFWLDWLKREYLEWIITFFERWGLGLRLWLYESGNDAAKTAVQDAARASDRKVNLFVPVVPGRTGTSVGGVEVVDAPTVGTESMQYFIEAIDGYIERYVIGQSMSSGADNEDGLGGTGRAKFAQNTKQKIIAFDANNQGEYLTGSDDEPGLLSVMKRWTFPHLRDVPVRFVYDVDTEDPKDKLDAAKVVFDMGVELKTDEVRGMVGLSKPEPGDDTIGGGTPGLGPLGPDGQPQPGAGDSAVPPGTADDEEDDPFPFGRTDWPYLYLDQSKHPRGQPRNRGQFSSSPGGGSKPAPSPKEKAQKHITRQVRGHAVNAALASAQAAGHVLTTAQDAAKRLGQGDWERLSPEAQKKLTKVYRVAKAVEHKAMLLFHGAKKLAAEVARERGLPPDHVDRAARILAVADLAMAWTVNMPATAALTGSMGLAKVSSWIPVASLAYIAYSTARDPLATIRAARKVLGAGKGEPVQHAAVDLPFFYQHDPERGDMVATLLHRLDTGGDWYEALIHAALDEADDLAGAVAMADQALQAQYARDPLQYKKKPGRWITIGGTKGADGKRQGGSPVYVEGGRITKGHPSLTGKKIDALKEEGEKSTHRQQLHQSKGHARAVWGKRSRQEGIDSASLHQLAADLLEHDRAHKSDHHRMLKDAREALSQFGGQHKTIKLHADKTGGDHDKIKGLDQVAEDIRRQYPAYFGEHDTASERLYELLAEGNPELMSEEDAYEQAFEHLAEGREAYRPSEEPIPFQRGE